MKTYLIPEELLNRVISTIVDYLEDCEELDNIGGIPNCWPDDLVLLEAELNELKELKDETVNKYEVEVEGEFRPFGVTDET